MGYDKPDLGFVVHYQAPGSVISYYQQVGRAGRAIDHADVVLLRGAEDRRIQDFFIEQAFPRRERVDRVLDALDDGDGATTQELMGVVNLGKGRIEAMLKVLDVEGAVARDGTRWPARAGQRLALRRRPLRAHHRAAPARAGGDGAVRRRRALPDARAAGGARRPRSAGLRRCAVCAGPHFAGPLDPELVREAALHLRSSPLVLDVKKMAPDAEGKMRKLADGVRAEEGRALARLGDGGWDPLVQAGRREGRFDDELVAAAAEAVRAWGIAPALGHRRPVAPHRRARARLRAARWRRASGSPFEPVLERVGDNPPQREMANSAQQVANVRGAFKVTAAPPPGPGPARRRHPLLRLDARDGRRPAAPQGREAVYPFALTTAF